MKRAGNLAAGPAIAVAGAAGSSALALGAGQSRGPGMIGGSNGASGPGMTGAFGAGTMPGPGAMFCGGMMGIGGPCMMGAMMGPVGPGMMTMHGGGFDMMRGMGAAFDKNGDGIVGRDELRGGLDAGQKTFDGNADGTLSLAGYQGPWSQPMQRAMVRHFQMPDVDGNGEVTLRERDSPRPRDGAQAGSLADAGRLWHPDAGPWRRRDDDRRQLRHVRAPGRPGAGPPERKDP